MGRAAGKVARTPTRMGLFTRTRAARPAPATVPRACAATMTDHAVAPPRSFSATSGPSTPTLALSAATTTAYWVTTTLRLPAEPALAADLAGDAGDLGGERRQLVDHRVDGGLEFQDLAAGVDVDLLRQVAARHRRRHQRDVADLAGEVVGHGVDVVGEVLPRARHVRHMCLATEAPLGAHLTGDAGHLVRERGQRVDHGVDDVRQGGDLTLGLDRDLLGQVTPCDSGGHLGDRADLAGQVRRHHVDVVRQVLPRTRGATDDRLATEVALRADLAGDARDFVGEGGELVDHRVDGLLELKDLAPRGDVDLLRQIALGNRCRHLRDVAHLGGQVARHGVDRVGQVGPGARDARHLGLAAQGSLGAHLTRHSGHFRGEHGELVHHAVEDGGDVSEQTLAVGRQPGAEVAVSHGGEPGQQLPQLLLAGGTVDGLDRPARHAHPRSAPQEPSRRGLGTAPGL